MNNNVFEDIIRQDDLEQVRNVAEFIGFDYTQWQYGEENLIRPRLEGMGYTAIEFYNIEADSFGPLIRGVKAIDVNGDAVKFWYG